MSDASLRALAQAAGIETEWRDVFGQVRAVAPPTLLRVLAALDLPAHSPADIADSHHRATTRPALLPPLVTAQLGWPVELPAAPDRYCLTLEDGRTFDGYAEPHPLGATIPPILEPGYHHLRFGAQQTLIAVAPRQGFTVPEAVGRPKSWGLAVQLYALRRQGDAGLGDFTALQRLAAGAAARGAQAIAISPVHAQFSADPDRFSPYAPSSRVALNVLHADLDAGDAALEARDLIDWPAAARHRLARFRALFATHLPAPDEAAFLDARGGAARAHALFEALHAHFFDAGPRTGHGRGPWHWRDWPAPFRDPDSTEVAAFAATHAREVAFHGWLQYRADQGLAAAQAACRAAGMGIGLISDLAVGADSGGSQCWSRQSETLLGLSIGAPPDLLQRHGQNWGLSAFSPRGLAASGFATYRAMLDTALAHAGGMRIDHAMGLNRLWVIPDGASGAEGAYLRFPERDLLRLIALESIRHRAIVLGEDLGTVPEGFTDRLCHSGIDGLRVLWFERDQAGNFTSPHHWTARAAAMTSTHDLPTVAGWWRGTDLAWSARLGATPDESARQSDRAALWQAFEASGSAAGPAPAADAPEAAVDAACAHIGQSGCELVMLPVEDALGLSEQPNLPGTLDEHPNWQRRLHPDVESLLDDAGTVRRLSRLSGVRG